MKSIRCVTNNRKELDIVKSQNLRFAQKLIGKSNAFEICMRCRINGRNYYYNNNYWYCCCYRPTSLGICTLNRFNHLSAAQENSDDRINISHWMQNVFSVKIMLNSVIHTQNDPSFQTQFYFRMVQTLFELLIFTHLDLSSTSKNETGIVNFHFVANVRNIKKNGPFSWICHG